MPLLLPKHLKTILALLRWDPLRCVPEAWRRRPCAQHPHNHSGQPVQIPNQNTKEILKIMVLQHAVCYHEVWDWIHQQDQSQLTYQALLSKCQLLKSCNKMFQKAKEKGHAELTSLSTATSSASSIHKDALLAYLKCPQCGYCHSPSNCLAHGQECNKCGGQNHITALYQRRSKQSSQGSRTKSPSDTGTSPWQGCNTGSRYKSNCSPKCSTCQCNRTPFYSSSHSPSHSSSHSLHHHNNHRYNRRTTPFWSYQDSIKIVTVSSHTDSLETQDCTQEGTLLPKCTSDGQVIFYTWLHLTPRTGMKHWTVKINPSASVNTIPLSRYQKIFPQKIAENKYPKPSSLKPTSHSWISHDSSPQPFLGQFITDIRHVSQARSYPTCFYVFEDATSPHILLSYATSEWLGILQFNILNLVAQEHTDAITFPTISGLRKTVKSKMVTFNDPLTTKIPQPHWIPSISPPSSSSLRTTAKAVTFKDPVKGCNPTYHSPSLSSNIWPKSVLKAPKPQVAEASSTPQLSSILNPHKPNSVQQTISPNAVGQDIVALKCTFPGSFDTISKMPSTYTIRTDPNITPVWHVSRKVPMVYWEQIECTLNDMVTKGLIAPVSWTTKWVSSLMYPCKPDGSLHICLNPKDLNKAIVWEHYKALTLEEISHYLNGATASVSWMLRRASRASMSMRSLHTWPLSTCIVAGTGSCACLLAWWCPRTSFRCAWTR